jgi:predicted dehydrogenase
MARVVPFNTRAENPAKWVYRAYLGPDFQDVMLREKAGDIAVISGRNSGKIERILSCVNAGMHVLADKPWIIDHSAFALLDSALSDAGRKHVAAYDIMTERYEITTILQRLIAADEAVFGVLEKGTPSDPAVVKKSVHHITKTVAGKPLRRPWWFFDTAVQGEGLVDVTTHLVDLVFWTLFPEQAIDWRNDIEMVSASRWPTVLTLDEFSRVTGRTEFPKELALDGKGNLPYFCNGQMIFRVRGVTAQVQVEWKYEAPPGGGDTHYSMVKGTKARVIVLQQKEQNYLPELFVEPAPGVDHSAAGRALSEFVKKLAAKELPGVSVVEDRGRWRINIPQTYRIGHEAHFGQVTEQFLKYVNGAPMPAWERPNMLAKYFITTKALELAREK